MTNSDLLRHAREINSLKTVEETVLYLQGLLMTPLLSAEQVANHFQISESTLKNKWWKANLPPLLCGGVNRWRRKDVIELEKELAQDVDGEKKVGRPTKDLRRRI